MSKQLTTRSSQKSKSKKESVATGGRAAKTAATKPKAAVRKVAKTNATKAVPKKATAKDLAGSTVAAKTRRPIQKTSLPTLAKKERPSTSEANARKGAVPTAVKKVAEKLTSKVAKSSKTHTAPTKKTRSRPTPKNASKSVSAGPASKPKSVTKKVTSERSRPFFSVYKTPTGVRFDWSGSSSNVPEKEFLKEIWPLVKRASEPEPAPIAPTSVDWNIFSEEKKPKKSKPLYKAIRTQMPVKLNADEQDMKWIQDSWIDALALRNAAKMANYFTVSEKVEEFRKIFSDTSEVADFLESMFEYGEIDLSILKEGLVSLERFLNETQIAVGELVRFFTAKNADPIRPRTIHPDSLDEIRWITVQIGKPLRDLRTRLKVNSDRIASSSTM